MNEQKDLVRFVQKYTTPETPIRIYVKEDKVDAEPKFLWQGLAFNLQEAGDSHTYPFQDFNQYQIDSVYWQDRGVGLKLLVSKK